MWSYTSYNSRLFYQTQRSGWSPLGVKGDRLYREIVGLTCGVPILTIQYQHSILYFAHISNGNVYLRVCRVINYLACLVC